MLRRIADDEAEECFLASDEEPSVDFANIGKERPRSHDKKDKEDTSTGHVSPLPAKKLKASSDGHDKTGGKEKGDGDKAGGRVLGEAQREQVETNQKEEDKVE